MRTKTHHLTAAPLLTTVLVLSGLVLLGCGDDGGPPRITVGGIDIAFEPETVTASAGVIELRFENDGALPHNLVFEGDTGLDAGSADVLQERGQKATYTLDVAPGTYVFFCSVSGHREAGMEGTLVVE